MTLMMSKSKAELRMFRIKSSNWVRERARSFLGLRVSKRFEPKAQFSFSIVL